MWLWALGARGGLIYGGRELACGYRLNNSNMLGGQGFALAVFDILVYVCIYIDICLHLHIHMFTHRCTYYFLEQYIFAGHVLLDVCL